MEYVTNVENHELKHQECWKGGQMNTKSKKIISIALCILLLFVTFASLFYIVEEKNHHCTGEDCPICANIHLAEQTLRTIGNGSINLVAVAVIPALITLLTVGKLLFVFETSLVSQKVRLND